MTDEYIAPIDALKKKIDDHIMKVWREGAEYKCCVKCGFCSACCQRGADDEVHQHQEDIYDIRGLGQMIDQLVATYKKELNHASNGYCLTMDGFANIMMEWEEDKLEEWYDDFAKWSEAHVKSTFQKRTNDIEPIWKTQEKMVKTWKALRGYK